MATVEVAKPHYTWLTSSDQSRNNRKPLAPATLPGHKRPPLSSGLSRPRGRAEITIIFIKGFTRTRETSPVSPIIIIKKKYRSLFVKKGGEEIDDRVWEQQLHTLANWTRSVTLPRFFDAVHVAPLRQMKKTRSNYLSPSLSFSLSFET